MVVQKDCFSHGMDLAGPGRDLLLKRTNFFPCFYSPSEMKMGMAAMYQ